MRLLLRLKVIVLFIALLSPACGQPQGGLSRTLVSDVEHTPVKRQSIGNCWLYAVGTWAESLHLSATDRVINLSESYWTYWHFYNQMVNSHINEISTGGSWWTAVRIIGKHGYIAEGDFIPSEGELEMSGAQAQAEWAVNAALGAGGVLADPADRSPEAVIRVLDGAFGVDMAAVRRYVQPASALVTGRSASGRTLTLADAISSDAAGDGAWQFLAYPVVYGKDVKASLSQRRQRSAAMRRVMKAVNDYQPVMMSVHIDFNGLDRQDSAFKLETIEQSGGAGTQGGHMVVLEDYVVDRAPDGRGGLMSIGEGDVSTELKARALQGDVRYLKIKNSWGTNRADRGITDGYHKFYSDYLDVPWEVVDEQGSGGYYASALKNFILPPGY